MKEEKEQFETETSEQEVNEEQAQNNEQVKNEEQAPEANTSKEEDEALTMRFMRLQADFTNYKKRTEKEKSDIYRLANEKLLTEMLPVIDNMERALAHAEDSTKERLQEGVEMVFNSLINVLSNAGLKEIEALEKPFDHNLHHAVLTEPSDEFDAETVTMVMQKGYTLNDKVIRPSMVKVSE